MTKSQKHSNSLRPASCIQHHHRGFTLVELLVVIAIIGILAALIATAAAGALKRGRQAQIKTELDQIHMAFQTYADTNGSFPPNCQVDGTSEPLNETQVLADLRQHLKRAFPRHREPEELIARLAGLEVPTSGNPLSVLGGSQGLQGGMSAGEAIVFWLGGFSDDPRYPISGEGGPSYAIPSVGAADNYKLDPIESRKWTFPFAVTRLGPRGADNYFDRNSPRFIEYTATINGQTQNRRINFWQYTPARLQQPYLYFDTSRHEPSADFDPPAATTLAGDMVLHVHAIKVRPESAANTLGVQFATPEKFQILHAGVDDEWGEAAFEQMSLHNVPPNQILVFPGGPFTGDVADTIVNFSDATLEASQP